MTIEVIPLDAALKARLRSRKLVRKVDAPNDDPLCRLTTSIIDLIGIIYPNRKAEARLIAGSGLIVYGAWKDRPKVVKSGLNVLANKCGCST
jgi:hypothetical protein